MKILHVYKDIDPPVRGGIERYIALMARFQKQWAEVEILCCSGNRNTYERDLDGVKITEVGEWGRLQSTPVSPAFPGCLKKADADIVVLHCPMPTAELAWLLTKPRGALVVRYHSDIIRQKRAYSLYRPFQQRLLRYADAILPTSKRYQESSDALKAHTARCEVIPLGICPEDYADPSPDLVTRYKDAYGENFVLFLGRHRYYKGLEYLVRAAKQIQGKVVIAGDGPERTACMALARAIGVDIAFPGELTHEEVVAHLHGCAVFAFPSVERSEAFGLSMLEAQVCGKPVVATRLGTGVEYVNKDGKTGLNVPPRNPDALAEAVHTLLLDAGRRETLGQCARARVCSEFNAETIARQEFEVYQRIVCSKAHG